MPFDRISRSQLFWMRVATAFTFGALGLGLAVLAGGALFAAVPPATRFDGQVGGLFLLCALVYGLSLTNAGAMLLELVTVPPFKMAINVPFVAANFQTALVMGLVALVFAVQHAARAGEAGAAAVLVQWLLMGGFGLNLLFVLMTKAHWNFTENTGKPLP